MKTKLALIGVVSLAFAACDKKEEVTEKAKPAVMKQKVARPEQAATGSKSTAHLPVPSAGPEIAQGSTIESQGASSPPIPAPQPATPQATLSASGKTTEELKAERLERMAKAREERTAQMTAQMTTRFKEQDANGDGFLAKDEVSERMQRRFGEADKNGDGFLDAAEQQAMIQATSQRMSEGGGQGRNGQGGGFNRQGRGNRNP